jgi:hypothetical protein
VQKLRLSRFTYFGKPETLSLLADASRSAPSPGRAPNGGGTSAVVCDGTADTRTPYAVEAMGDGRNSAMSRKISANRFRGIGRVAEGNFTPPPSRNRT